MIVNGEKVTLSGKMTVADFLTSHSYDISRVALEKNGSIVPKSAFDTETLTDTDKIEIVCFVGGG
jgi:sulfur carrier protein